MDFEISGSKYGILGGEGSQIPVSCGHVHSKLLYRKHRNDDVSTGKTVLLTKQFFFRFMTF